MKMKGRLQQAEKELYKEDGNINKVAEIKKEIAKTEWIIENNNKRRKELENKITKIAESEIETTIKRTKPDPRALEAPKPSTTKRNTDFVHKVKVPERAKPGKAEPGKAEPEKAEPEKADRAL